MSIKIGLDAGHGLHTSGKQTPDGIKEWTLNDDVCDRIEAILKDYDCEIIRTDHNEGNVDEPLSQRVREYLNAGVACLVSIHHNAFNNQWNCATGVEVYTDRTPIAGDDKLANLIYQKLTTYTGLRGRGVKRANFQIINQDKVPAVLVEGGFMDSTIDYKVITSNEGKENYAKAVAESLIEFCGLVKKSAPTPEKISVIYQVHDYTKNKWLNNIIDTDNQNSLLSYAGNYKNAIDAVYANLTKGNIYYRVHIKATSKYPGRWLPEVKNRDDYAGNLGQPIDAIMIRTDIGRVRYQVHTAVSGRWLPEVSGYGEIDHRNGYAGNIGEAIDGIRIRIE